MLMWQCSAICLGVLEDEADVRRLKCKHVFHTACIDSWFQRRHTDCVLCGAVLVPERSGVLGI